MIDDVFLCEGARTPIGRYGGVLSAVRPDDLLALTLRYVCTELTQLPAGSIDDVVIGCANQAGEDNRNIARMAVLLAGLPVSVPACTVNRLCASGLESIAIAARCIAAGDAELVIAGGVESMSRAPFVLPKAETAFSRDARVFDSTIGWRFVNPAIESAFGIDSMPVTGENVAAEFSVSRTDQDVWALRSQTRAAKAIGAGRFLRESLAVPVPQRRGEPVLVAADEHPRETSLERLAALPTPFRTGGTVTAGNAAGVNDGACVVVIASARAVNRFGLQPKARIRAATVAGVEPRLMGIGPVPATRQLVARTGLSLDDIGVIEINEAFAAQVLASLRELGIDESSDHINPNGGAIALGHPLGMTGARLALTASLELAERDERYAICTACIGVGQGMAMLLERAGD